MTMSKVLNIASVILSSKNLIKYLFKHLTFYILKPLTKSKFLTNIFNIAASNSSKAFIL
jgi:hypothetical protein